jgi:hypothetical protein
VIAKNVHGAILSTFILIPAILSSAPLLNSLQHFAFTWSLIILQVCVLQAAFHEILYFVRLEQARAMIFK